MKRRSSRLSRRAFLAQSGAVLTLPYLVTKPSFGQPRVAANERIRLGFIGVGLIANQHLSTFLGNPETQVVAVCDVDRKKREGAAKRVNDHYGSLTGNAGYRGCDAYNEYERILERDDIDAVVISTPDHWHAVIAVAACQAGKDVYCEKPLSLTIREGRQMADAARRYATVFQTGSQQRSSDNFRFACELVRNGYIGKLLTVNASVAGPSEPAWLPSEPVPAGFDWDRWLGPTPRAAYSEERCKGDWGGGGWRKIRAYSGGMMTDWGAHHFDIAQWGMGMDESGPIAVIPPGAEDNELLTYRYANGVTMFKGGANGVLFTGTDGKVEVNRGYLKTWPAELKDIQLKPTDTRLYRSDSHTQDWLECIRERRRPICDVEIGARSATVCHLGNIAFWTGRALRWNPETETLLDDEAAARWLDRPKRAPYLMPA